MADALGFPTEQESGRFVHDTRARHGELGTRRDGDCFFCLQASIRFSRAKDSLIRHSSKVSDTILPFAVSQLVSPFPFTTSDDGSRRTPFSPVVPQNQRPPESAKVFSTQSTIVGLRDFSAEFLFLLWHAKALSRGNRDIDGLGPR